MRSERLRTLAAVALLCLIGLQGHAETPEELPVLAQVGPWKYATNPIGYRNRIWFANANRWPDHNSADIWSMKPDGTDLRMERRLFSQDVGEPMVHQGLLYWPYEDPRVSLGWGQIAVTDGEDWRVLDVRTGRQFHMHGLYPGAPGQMLAAASSRSAQILTSDDRGATWSQLYEAERLERRYSRTYKLVWHPAGILGDVMEFGNGPNNFRLLRHGPNGPREIAEWPSEIGLVRSLIPHPDGAIALIGSGDQRRQVRISGHGLEYLPAPEGVSPVDRAGSVLLVRESAQRYQLWSGDKPLAALVVGEASHIRLIAGQPVVAGKINGRGAIWATPGRSIAELEPPPPLPNQISAADPDVSAARREITDALAEPRNYLGHGRNLRDVIDRWVSRGLSGDVLAKFLNGPFPDGEVKLIGGRAFASHQRFGRWILTWGMRRAQSGRVPVSWLRAPFDEPQNDSVKYFSEPLAAIWTVAATGQNDTATIAALKARVANDSDPPWLRTDAEAALRVLEPQ